jgi:hypothetical protein
VAEPDLDGMTDPGRLTIVISANVPTCARVVETSTQRVQLSNDASEQHALSGRNGETYAVELSLAS